MSEEPIEEENPPEASRQGRTIILRVLALLMFLITVSLMSFGLYFRQLLSYSDLSLDEVRQKYRLARQKQPDLADKINLLILGLDQRDDELEHTLLTDTIIFASLDTQESQLKLLPIPRDLWLNHLKTKINALYYYGEVDEKMSGPEYLSRELTTILNQPINYWLVVDYRHLGQLVDSLGGVDLFLDQGFTDPKFPNPAYVAATDSGEPKYLSISFTSGDNHLTGQRALEFVRSRSSTDQEQGNDLARSSRQLQLVQAMIAKLRSRETIFNPQRLGKLYLFWQEKIATNLADEDLLAILLEILPKRRLSLEQKSIPATYQPTGEILVHPPTSKYGQWVWETQTGDWSELQEFVASFLE